MKKLIEILDSQNGINAEEAMALIEVLKNKCYISGMSDTKDAQRLQDIAWKLGNI